MSVRGPHKRGVLGFALKQRCELQCPTEENDLRREFVPPLNKLGAPPVEILEVSLVL